MSFSVEELERYRRQLSLPDIGEVGQKKLKAARVIVIGAGGLGSPVIQYLAAVGVGTILIFDDDSVSLSNLQRQVMFTSEELDEKKALLAEQFAERLNPNVTAIGFPLRLTTGNIDSFFENELINVVLDCSDNMPTRLLISDACFKHKIPLVTGALGGMDGCLTTFKPYETTDGVPNPTYRCLFPSENPAKPAGVLGVIAGIIGCMMVNEAVKEIVGYGRSLVGRLQFYDLHSSTLTVIPYQWDKSNPLNGTDNKVIAEDQAFIDAVSVDLDHYD